jgi:hypothetical protein
MKPMRLVPAVALFAVAACATNAGVWNDSYANMDQKLLRSEIEKSLRADSWTTTDEDDKLVAEKADGGGHKTAAIFSFTDAGKGSSYEMLGKSGHNVNWLTFGILGASMKHKTIYACTHFIENFQHDHPHNTK